MVEMGIGNAGTGINANWPHQVDVLHISNLSSLVSRIYFQLPGDRR